MRKRKKSTKPQINWTELILSGLVDLTIGLILILIERIIK